MEEAHQKDTEGADTQDTINMSPDQSLKRPKCCGLKLYTRSMHFSDNDKDMADPTDADVLALFRPQKVRKDDKK